MKIYEETNLYDFEFWSGGKQLADRLTHEELAIIQSALEEIYSDGIEDTLLNDIFWFDCEWICEILNNCSHMQEGIKLTEDDIFERPYRWEVK